MEANVNRVALEADEKKWIKHVSETVALLKPAFFADYVVLGGGNSKKIEELPEGCRRGGNHNAYFGGVRMWEQNPWETLELDSGLDRQSKRAGDGRKRTRTRR